MTIVRRASTGGASLPGETPPASLAESLRRLDFYAVDLREGSRVGGCLSILTTMTIAFLFFMQVSALMTPSYVTDIVVDHSPDAPSPSTYESIFRGASARTWLWTWWTPWAGDRA